MPATVPTPTNAIDAAAGKAQKNQGVSLNSFLASLTCAAIIFGVELLIFFLVRNKLPLIYKPREYSESEEPCNAPSSPISSVHAIFRTSDDIIRDSGLDAYFFIRYLQTLLKVFIPLALVIIPILLPLNVISGKNRSGGVTGLDQLSWSNIEPTHTSIYWAHLTVAVGAVVYVCYVSFDELWEFSHLRQRHLQNSTSVTILVTAIPKEKLSEKALRQFYGGLPGGIRHIQINHDVSKLCDKANERESVIVALEIAEANLIKRVLRAADPHMPCSEGTGPLWERYLTKKDREYIRLPPFDWTWAPPIPLFGKKVDKIDHYREELSRLNEEIKQGRQELQKLPKTDSALIQFENPISACIASQCLSYHLPKHMIPQVVNPDDIIWENLPIKWWQRYVRTAFVVTAVAALLLGWGIPITFTGLVSQISYLTSVLPQLGWVNNLPGWLLGVIQGILPTLMLSILMALVPVILRFLARRQGEYTGNDVELSVQNYYFTFLFLQVFLVASLSAGITSVTKDITKNIRSIPSVLAENLPKASNYFFSYMLIQALSVSAGVLIQIGGLVNWFILSPLLDQTARQKWNRFTDPPQMEWGTLFPVYTNLACIGLIYSVIAPIILIFNVIAFGLFWIVYRYNSLYVTKSPSDTAGRLYPKAINQLFTGVYFMELCLIGLFFLVRDSQNRVACKGQAAVMIITTIFTAIYQYVLNDAFEPLLKFIPISDTHGEESDGPSEEGNLTGVTDDNSLLLPKALCPIEPEIWIPEDSLGVSQDEISQIERKLDGNVRIERDKQPTHNKEYHI